MLRREELLSPFCFFQLFVSEKSSEIKTIRSSSPGDAVNVQNVARKKDYRNTIGFDNIFHEAHIFTFTLYKDYDTPGKHYNLCLYPWRLLDNTTLNSCLGL